MAGHGNRKHTAKPITTLQVLHTQTYSTHINILRMYSSVVFNHASVPRIQDVDVGETQ